MSHVPLKPIGKSREQVVDDRTFATQRENLGKLESRVEDTRAKVHQGWGEKYVERVHAKGKLTSRERIDLLKDSGSEVYEVGTFVNEGREFGKLT
ncbi:MAG: propionyl-CoA carboxylase, partial [Myxococcales bacterium]|nr:propionyl-CoA carboxylase [Myxococcales bacterium]